MYNDLKPDHIMIGMGDKLPARSIDGNCFGKARLSLVDFGCSTRYMDDKGYLLKKVQLDSFQGNFITASIGQLNFHSTGRRDDLAQLCYLMIFLLNKGQLPILKDINMDAPP